MIIFWNRGAVAPQRCGYGFGTIRARSFTAPVGAETVTLDKWYQPLALPTRRPPQAFWSGWVDRCSYVAPGVVVPPVTPPVPPFAPGGRAAPLGLGSADSDALRACQDRYDAAGDNLVGDRFYTDDLPARLDLPYAQVQSEQARPPEFQASIDEFDLYLDYRKITVTVVAVGKDATGGLLERFKGLYAFKVFNVPNAFHRATWFVGEELKPDPSASRRGERVYRGRLDLELWAVRRVP